MPKSLLKLLLTITLLVAFVGQTMADHFISSNTTLSEHFTKIQVDIIVNDRVNALDDDCCEVECCENQCICPANACASIAYIDNNLPLTESMALSDPLLTLATKATYFIAASLYRPPIFTT
ncbi:hypothetical protein NBRC116592_25270 [Colwellia sp. KU-HH00111]|uniref:hypothetical protein n=1 Tax=Colwellia sp. KU-HH00111 TaxID=3127652 RepID=UPI00310A8824